MHSQSISCVASFVAKGALMTEAADVGFHMLLDCVSQLGTVMTLGTLPHCLSYKTKIKILLDQDLVKKK